MINLLPLDYKKEMQAARVNVTLGRYVIFVIITIAAAFLIFAGGYFITIQARSQAKTDLASNNQQLSQYNRVKSEAEQFESNLQNAKAILDHQVSFSKLIVQIAKTLPSDAVLESLHLTTADIGGKPITLDARTANSGSAPLKLKDALESSPLFDDVSIISIKRDQSASSDSKVAADYPVEVQLSASLVKPTGQAGGKS